MSLKIKLPPVFKIHGHWKGNTIQQMVEPGSIVDGDVANYTSGKLKGKVITGSVDGVQILILEKPSSSPSHFFGTIKARPATSASENGAWDLSNAEWMSHPKLSAPSGEKLNCPQHLEDIVESWQGAFSYLAENQDKGINGLRLPQIGAVHAIHAHWAVSNEPATIVMPTGTGKTETMLAVLVSAQCNKTLVVVPTDVLRTQIAEKFLTLGVLKEFGVVSAEALLPVVGILKHKPKDAAEVDAFFEKCSVIVTTSHIAGQCTDEVQESFATHCDFLFIDEAHHIAAPTWSGLKARFSLRRILQFTATPFREDDKEVEGRIIFKYPLRKAQQEGYFRQISYKPINVFQPALVDEAIAAAAVAQLRADAEYKHVLMARVDSVDRARKVFSIYEKCSEFNPVQIHTGIAKKERAEVRKKIISGESRIVVCVDMLGEGFDLPELKIAAFHDIKKSLAVTLQLAGRFTRARPDLGSPTFIANVAEVRVREELKKLYRQDTDWNFLLPQLSEEVIEEQISLREFTEGFANFPTDIPLRNLRPAMSTVIYKTKCEQWTPENFLTGIPGIASFERVHFDVNPHKNTLVIVTAQKVSIDWADIKDVFNWHWELHVLFWDATQNLLFIHGSTNKGEFKQLAKSVGGDDVVLVNEQAVFRCFSGVNRLRFQNVGLTRQLGRLIRYTGSMGSDVELGLGELLKKNTRKSVLFGTGFEGGKKVTVGASRKGRIWSFATANVEALVKWSSLIGSKVLDETIDPDEILKGTLEAEIVSERPSLMPIGIDWPEDVYKELETSYQFVLEDQEEIFSELFETDIALTSPSETGDLTFEISSEKLRVDVRLELFDDEGTKDYRFVVSGEKKVLVKHKSSLMTVEDFFSRDAPVIWFVDGSSLEGNVYTELKTKYPPYDSSKIEVWDWTGIDLKQESQGTAKTKTSIQFRVIERLCKQDYDIIFDDDGKGEAADVVAIQLREAEKEKWIDVEFYHCKFSKDVPGARVKDLYEVCGQAQKSIHWMERHEKHVELFSHLLRREPKRSKSRQATRFEKGDHDELVKIKEMSEVWPVRLKIFVVQPGLSKAKVSQSQLQLLSVTDNHLLETYQLPFGVIASP
jgi:superfamily II DNA or RNA helicase